MADTNTIIIEGRLTDKAQKKTHNGKEFYTFRIANNEFFKSISDKKTNFIDCEWWEPNGAAQYLEKAKIVVIVGRLSQSEWTDAEGKKRSKHYIKVDRLDLRGSPKKEEAMAGIAESDDSNDPGGFLDSFNDAPAPF